ncbi:MAG TPA: class I SAM-dependent methyltransferase [Thermoplasmata archaeon]|nr:class I SAM-dependent methyltransferase [Thermoplasmata archaeon]
MTQVEAALLREGLNGAPLGRILEIGSGSGRLTAVLLARSPQVVASDATLPLLRRLVLPGLPPFPKVAANVFHLPFPDGSFAAVTMFRVFGFLPDPALALREIRRVLRPDGRLVLSVEPHPSWGSLVDDLKVGLARGPDDGPPRMTFSRAPIVPVRPSAYPSWSPSRARLRELVEAERFSLVADYPCGLEDFVGLRRLPPSIFLGMARALSRLGGFPTRILVLQRAPGGSA